MRMDQPACARGRSEYDMLRGQESYKRRWSEELRTEVEVVIATPGAAARLHAFGAIYLKHRLKRIEWVNRVADQISGFLARAAHKS